MTATDTGFLDAICAEPRDTGLRLIFADWLDEHGESDRAEFIRVQCELVETPETLGLVGLPNERFKALRRRERELLLANWREWVPKGWTLILSPRWEFNLDDFLACKFRRGFIEVVHCTCADWLQHGPAVVRAQPVLEVRLTDQFGVRAEVVQAALVENWSRYDGAIPWARADHPGRGLDALPPLENPHAG